MVVFYPSCGPASALWVQVRSWGLEGSNVAIQQKPWTPAIQLDGVLHCASVSLRQFLPLQTIQELRQGPADWHKKTLTLTQPRIIAMAS